MGELEELKTRVSSQLSDFFDDFLGDQEEQGDRNEEMKENEDELIEAFKKAYGILDDSLKSAIFAEDEDCEGEEESSFAGISSTNLSSPINEISN